MLCLENLIAGDGVALTEKDPNWGAAYIVLQLQVGHSSQVSLEIAEVLGHIGLCLSAVVPGGTAEIEN